MTSDANTALSLHSHPQEDQAASAAASPRTAGEEQEDGGGEDVEEDGGGEVDEDDSKLGQEKSDMVVSRTFLFLLPNAIYGSV